MKRLISFTIIAVMILNGNQMKMLGKNTITLAGKLKRNLQKNPNLMRFHVIIARILIV